MGVLNELRPVANLLKVGERAKLVTHACRTGWSIPVRSFPLRRAQVAATINLEPPVKDGAPPPREHGPATSEQISFD